MSELLVIEKTMCDRCEGEGYLTHPVYQAFYEYLAGIDAQQPAEINAAKEAWWRKNGYDLDDENPPEETYPCTKCQGTGDLWGYVPLHEAMQRQLPGR